MELESIKRLASEWTHHTFENDSTNYYICNFKTKDAPLKVVAAAAPQMGMTASAVLAMKLIQYFSPKYLIMTGIAAGIKDAVNLGDILVADPSWDYGSGKIEEIDGEEVFHPDPRPIALDIDLKSKLNLLAGDSMLLEKIKQSWAGDKPPSSLNLHIGPVASGAAVLAHGEIAKSIVAHNRKLLGIEMETYGVMYAANNCPKPRPTVLSLKSVCDFADAEKNDKYQRYAAHTSAAVLHELAVSYLQY